MSQIKSWNVSVKTDYAVEIQQQFTRPDPVQNSRIDEIRDIYFQKKVLQDETFFMMRFVHVKVFTYTAKKHRSV
jgi:hypothetical protein